MPEENKHRLGAAKTLLTLSHWEDLRGIVLLCFVYAFFYLCVFWKPQTLLWKIHILALYRLLNSVQPTQQYINFCHMIWFFSYGLHGKKGVGTVVLVVWCLGLLFLCLHVNEGKGKVTMSSWQVQETWCLYRAELWQWATILYQREGLSLSCLGAVGRHFNTITIISVSQEAQSCCSNLC